MTDVPASVLIPASSRVTLSDLKPGMLRGTFRWCIYDYADEAKIVVAERKNGVIRLDGSLKPAGKLLADYYAAKKDKNPAPWDKYYFQTDRIRGG